MKLYYPYPSNNGKHKYFIITNTSKKISFGAIGYEHYTEGHLDEIRKDSYIKRHQKREQWDNPNTAGYWSYRYLWLYPTYRKSYSQIKKDLKAKNYIP